MLFVVLFAAYALLGWRLFGQSNRAYSTMHRSCLTLIGLLLSPSNHNDKSLDSESTTLVEAVYLTWYALMVYLFGFNVIWAVLTETFASTKRQMTSESAQLHVHSHIVSGYVKRNVLLAFKVRQYLSARSNLSYLRLLGAMITMNSTSDRILASVEIEHIVKSIVNLEE
jgi:hypothetical protein